jgi:hypothetical protein
MKEGQKKRLVIYVLAIAILGSLLFILYWILGRSAPSVEKTHAAPSHGSLRELIVGQETNKANAPETQKQNQINSIIEGLTIAPQRPTGRDSLKVEIKARTPEEGKLSYKYQWKINGKAVADATGDVLPAGLARKNDIISITVVPSIEGVEYKKFQYTVNVLIYNAAPSIVLIEETHKEGDVITLQLKAEDLDGDEVHYALEAPLLEGMTIDKNTGKITWKPTKKQVGINRFGASAADSNGSKTTKTFEFRLDTK